MTLIDYAEVRKRLAEGADHPVSFLGWADKMRVQHEARLVTGTTTKAVVDVDGEVVLPGGMDRTLFPTVYKTVYLNHNLGQPVGACRNLAVQGDSIVAQTYISKTPLGEDVLTMIHEGVIEGQSWGFYILDASAPSAEEVRKYGDHERTIRKWMPREYSVTPMPACPGASDLKPVETQAAERMARLEEMVTKGLVHRSSAVAAGLPASSTRQLFPVSGPAQVGEEPVRKPATVLILG
jgi:HK97 family phage prohead protease